MLQTVKQACKFNPIIHDYRMAEGIESLTDLIKEQGDGREFFKRNFITQGMSQLLGEGMLRLSGQSDQAVFELNQAMGGGKTHMMIALGLLARDPKLRSENLPSDLNARTDFGKARIAAFNGRNLPKNYIWGDIATQLGASEKIRPFWADGPKPVDQNTWKEIIGDDPTLILLDEIPPHLKGTSTTSLGSGTLADAVVFSLSSLMSAALELTNCMIVIVNLSGSYRKESKELTKAVSNLESNELTDAVSNLQQETRRSALTITPVQLAGNEVYEILRKRLIDELPSEETISQVAMAYAQEVKKSVGGGISMERLLRL